MLHPKVLLSKISSRDACPAATSMADLSLNSKNTLQKRRGWGEGAGGREGGKNPVPLPIYMWETLYAGTVFLPNLAQHFERLR